jgi:hypothetical protein
MNSQTTTEISSDNHARPKRAPGRTIIYLNKAKKKRRRQYYIKCCGTRSCMIGNPSSIKNATTKKRAQSKITAAERATTMKGKEAEPSAPQITAKEVEKETEASVSEEEKPESSEPKETSAEAASPSVTEAQGRIELYLYSDPNSSK